MERESGDQVNSKTCRSAGGEFGESGGVEGDSCDVLDLEAVLADDAGGWLHGVEGAGGAGRVRYEEEGKGAAVRGEGELLRVADEVGELAKLAVGDGVEEDLLLAGAGGGGAAGGEEREGLAVGREDGIGVGASTAGGGDDAGSAGGRQGGDMETAAFAGAGDPGNGVGVGCDGCCVELLRGGTAGCGADFALGKCRREQDQGSKKGEPGRTRHRLRLARGSGGGGGWTAEQGGADGARGVICLTSLIPLAKV